MSDYTVLIPSDEDLRKLLPPAMATVMGEAKLIDKMAPFLETRFTWLAENFADPETMANFTDIAFFASRLLAVRAFIDAIPSLDVVLSPNGFGVVDTNSLSPASKERVAALLNSLEPQAVKLESSLLDHLWSIQIFIQANQGNSEKVEKLKVLSIADRWRETIICMPSVLKPFMSVDACRAILPVVAAAEHRLEREVTGEVILSEFRQRSWLLSRNDAHRCFRLCLEYIREFLNGDSNLHDYECRIINAIEKDSSLKKIWLDSDAGRLWRMPGFRNKKKSSGYVF